MNLPVNSCISYYSYIKPQLFQSLEKYPVGCISYYSYIKPQRCVNKISSTKSCISYYSYIKPQLSFMLLEIVLVVYRTIPTSNHNQWIWSTGIPRVVYRTIPTSNHNSHRHMFTAQMLYIVLFLHQTTTYDATVIYQERCISYYSYIKPQLVGV